MHARKYQLRERERTRLPWSLLCNRVENPSDTRPVWGEVCCSRARKRSIGSADRCGIDSLRTCSVQCTSSGRRLPEKISGGSLRTTFRQWNNSALCEFIRVDILMPTRCQWQQAIVARFARFVYTRLLLPLSHIASSLLLAQRRQVPPPLSGHSSISLFRSDT